MGKIRRFVNPQLADELIEAFPRMSWCYYIVLGAWHVWAAGYLGYVTLAVIQRLP